MSRALRHANVLRHILQVVFRFPASPLKSRPPSKYPLPFDTSLVTERAGVPGLLPSPLMLLESDMLVLRPFGVVGGEFLFPFLNGNPLLIRYACFSRLNDESFRELLIFLTLFSKAAKEVEKIGVECKFAKLENMAAAEPGGNGDD